MNKFMIALLCVLGASATTVSADDGQYFGKGDFELGLSGSYNYVDLEMNGQSETIDFFYADLGGSYYLLDNFSVGISTVWFYLPKVEGFEAYALGVEGNLRYHYQVNKHIVPYIGAHAGYYYADAEIDGTSEDDHINSYGVHAGFKVPINDHVFFDTQLKWTDYDMPWDTIDLTSTRVLFGLNIKF